MFFAKERGREEHFVPHPPHPGCQAGMPAEAGDVKVGVSYKTWPLGNWKICENIPMFTLDKDYLK